MRRAFTRLALLGLSGLVCGCRAPAPADSGSRQETATISPAGDAGDAGAAAEADAGAPPSQADPLEVFLEAARTDVERPYPVYSREEDPYYALARVLLVGQKLPAPSAPTVITEVLATSADPRALPALLSWVPSSRFATEALEQMSVHPRLEYLATIEAILAREDVTQRFFWGACGAFCEVLGLAAKRSAHVLALQLAAVLPGPEGRALLRRVATDRAASAPNPRTLAALVCNLGRTRIEPEARALASQRIMALSILGDRALMRRIARDPSEPSLVRTWAQRMALGKPEHFGWRTTRALERGDEGDGPNSELAASPCL